MPTKFVKFSVLQTIFAKNMTIRLKKFSLPSDGKKHRRRKGQMSDSEIMTILICFHFNTYRNFKHYYLCYVKGYLKDYFPNAVSYNRFVELESRVAVQMALFWSCSALTNVQASALSIVPASRSVTTSASRGTRYSRDTQRLARARWAGSMGSSCT